MEFTESISNSLVHPFGNAVTVVQDVVKGRCLVANKKYHAGEIIFEENALLYGSCDDDVDYAEKTAYAVLKEVNSKVTLAGVKKFIVAMSEDEVVESLDTARCFLQGLCLAIKTAQLATKDNLSNLSADETLRIELLKLLEPSKLEENIEVVRSLRRKHKFIIPTFVSDAIAGRLLGVLRNNQMELDQYGGSALFPGGSILEHDCFPNCSFSTQSCGDADHKMYMTAMRDIDAGDRLSIDYANDFYHPRRVRQAHLQKVYGFECTCSLCRVPETDDIQIGADGVQSIGSGANLTPLVEPFRVFKCPQPCCRNEGGLVGRVCIVYVYCTDETGAEGSGFVRTPVLDSSSDDDDDGMDDAILSEFEQSEALGDDDVNGANDPLVGLQCQSCGWRASADIVRCSIALEENLCDVTPDTFDELDRWKNEHNQFSSPQRQCESALPLHDQHYLFFWLVDDLAMGLAEEMQAVPDGDDCAMGVGKKRALRSCCTALRTLIKCLDDNPAVPQYHSEKLIYWDRLAQLSIATADSCCSSSNSATVSEREEREEMLLGAKHAFQMALNMSQKCAGEAAANTLQLQEMVNSMPMSIAELTSRYRRAL